MKTAFILASAFIFAVFTSSFVEAKTKGRIQTIAIENMTFSPSEISLTSKVTVEWINKDLVPHTVTSKNGSFDSTTIAPGAKWSFHFKGKGVFKYKCSFHPSMIGTLIVN